MDNNLSQNINEFTTFGIKIEKLSIFYGLFLIAWGVIISFISGSNSFTSYIPSILGLPIFVFAFLSVKFVTKKKTIYAYNSSFWFNCFFWWNWFFENIFLWRSLWKFLGWYFQTYDANNWILFYSSMYKIFYSREKIKRWHLIK